MSKSRPEFFIPRHEGKFELVEKKSRFIAQVWRIQSEEEAKAHLEQVRKEYHDASHHCWCFVVDEQLLRCSDDGEPQGTAGQPMLKVFEGEGVREVCCVVTRYFGKIELGTGGLKRAYGHSAKAALEAAELSFYETLVEFQVVVPYPLLQTVQLLVKEQEGIEVSSDFGVDVTLCIRVKKEMEATFLTQLTEKTAAQVTADRLGEVDDCLPWEGDFL